MKVFCDVETTGFSPTLNEVLVNSCIITDDNLEILDKMTFYSRPLDESRFGAENIHGISFDKAKQLPHPREAIYSFLIWLHRFGGNFDFIYHGLRGFDYLFLEHFHRMQGFQFKFWHFFNIERVESTVLMARKAGHTDNKLNKWADRLGLKLDHHNAESDVMACYEVYRFLSEAQTQTISGTSA